MSNILLIGKDLPDNLEFAETFTTKNPESQVFTSAKSGTETSRFESERIFSTTWNKSSAVSTHAFLIKAETKLQKINHIVFYFDSMHFQTKYELDKPEEISSAIDNMMAPYLYASSEVLKRLEQKKEKTVVSFMLRTYTSKLESLTSKTPGILPASSIVNIAETAFCSIAENFAVNIIDHEYLSVLLAKSTPANEFYKSERQTALWLIESMESVLSQKNKQTLKQASTWNRVGAKLQGGFSLFH